MSISWTAKKALPRLASPTKWRTPATIDPGERAVAADAKAAFFGIFFSARSCRHRRLFWPVVVPPGLTRVPHRAFASACCALDVCAFRHDTQDLNICGCSKVSVDGVSDMMFHRQEALENDKGGEV